MTDIANKPVDTFKFGGDLEVRRLGFGAMRITGPGIWGEPENREEAKAVLRHLLDLGINLIDTADAYGPETSENLIAEVLYPYAPGLVIATKGGLLRGGPGNWYPDGRPEHLREALDASLKRLKLDQIDVYQFHRPDPNVPFEESVGTLADLQKAGKIRHIGLSNVDTKQLRQAQQIVKIVSIQNRYNLTDRTAENEQLVDICEQEGIGFIPWNPLMNDASSKIDQIAKSHNATPSQIALAWLLKRSSTMLPIPGTSTVKHLEENTAAGSIQLTDEEFESLKNL